MSHLNAADEARFKKEADQRVEKRSDDRRRSASIARELGRHVGYRSASYGKGSFNRSLDNPDAFRRGYEQIDWSA